MESYEGAKIAADGEGIEYDPDNKDFAIEKIENDMSGLLSNIRKQLEKPIGDTIDHKFGTYDYPGGSGVYFDSSVPVPEVYAPASDMAKAYTPQRERDHQDVMKRYGPNAEPRYDERDRDIILGGLRSATEDGGGGLPEPYDIN